MALGIEVFRQNFAEYQDQYVLIGGMACDLILDEIGGEFRPTKDIDMVLIVEALTNEFANAFWAFIEKGGYEPRHRKDGKAEFYRFVNPKEVGYPSMIELFARPDSEVAFSYTGHLVPLHIDDDISSLSAILLNDAYYEFMLEGKIVAEGVSVVDAAHLVPLKMKAWLDLKDQKEKGMHVNDRDLRKHRQDIFRLFPLIDDNATIVVPKEVYDDIRAFISAVREMDFDIRQIGIDTSKEEILNVYEEIYVVER
jgi:hypothetical protein